MQALRFDLPVFKALILSAVVFLSACALTGKDPSYTYVSHRLQDGSLLIQSEFGEVKFTSLPGEAIEAHYLQTDVRQLPSFAKDESLRSVKPEIKMRNPAATIIAEVYNPDLYRDYIHLGKMDYLYDKVDLYDTLKLIMQGKAPTSSLLPIIDKSADIDKHMLHFLENHDEQRIASPGFAGDANKGKPAMVVSALIGKAPTMLFYAQALGEAGAGDAGFGDPTRTTMFDYWGVPSLQRWINSGRFDGGQLSDEEKSLREFYVKLLSFSANNPALDGEYADLHAYNLNATTSYDEWIFSFSR